MTITSYFGLKPCCDCGRTGNYMVSKNGYQFTVCSDCVQNYSQEKARNKIKIENPLTCKCDKWEIKEND